MRRITRILWRFVKYIQLIFYKYALRVFNKVSSLRGGGLVLTYDSNNLDLQDGVGAQCWRIISIYSICRSFGFEYLHSPIADLTATPLDPYQTIDERKTYIDQIESDLFSFIDKINDGTTLKYDHKHNSEILTWQRLINLMMRSYKLRKKIYILVKSAQPITDTFPTVLNEFKNEFWQYQKRENSIPTTEFVIHFRNGVIANHVEPWAKQSRWLSPDYFVHALEYLSGLSAEDLCITILTDSPITKVRYNIPLDQIDKWVLSGYDVLNGVVEIQPFDFSNSIFSRCKNIEIVRDIDPLTAIKFMRSAKIFIMSRSALSLVGGLLNSEGDVVFPAKMKISPLPNWIIAS